MRVNPRVKRRKASSSQPLIFTKYEGLSQTDLYTKELRFSTNMFDDHMPWGYNSLFAGIDELGMIGSILAGVGALNRTNHRLMDLGALESFVSNGSESAGVRATLQRNWRRIKDTTQDFFRNFG